MYYKVLKGLLACSLATTVFAPIALAANAESGDQSWLDRTDILIKAQENRKPQLAVETLQPISHYNKNSKGLLFLQGKITSHGGDANRLNDYTELLFPRTIAAQGNLLDMLNDDKCITDEDYRQPELIGWLYQFYIAERKDEVFAQFKDKKKASKDDIPAATQIFTPNWKVYGAK